MKASLIVRDVIERELVKTRHLFTKIRHRSELAKRRDEARLFMNVHPESENLKNQGWAKIIGPQVELSSLLQGCRQVFQADNGQVQPAKKQFFRQLLKEEHLNLGSPFLTYALHVPFLQLISEYLGYVPFLESVELLHSIPTPKSGSDFAHSQLWHLDRTDTSIMKIFTYIEEVKMENGPLSFISKELSRRVPSWLPHYLTDSDIGEYVQVSKQVQVLGPAGTTVFFDPRNCYHYGSRCEKSRLAFVCYYTSGYGYYNRLRRWNFDSAETTNLNTLQKFALGIC